MPNSYSVFGDISVRNDDNEPIEVTGRQAAILALLIAAHPDGVSKDRLIDQVWSDQLPIDPEATLYSVVSRLRAVVGNDLTTTPTGYRLRTGNIDTAAYETAVTSARSGTLTEMEAATRLWTGQPYRGLEDIADIRVEIEKLERVKRWAARDRLEAMTESGLAAAAADELAGLVTHDPFDEEILAMYMRAEYRSGRKRSALHTFRDYELRLAEETGLEPSAHIRELEVAILTDHLDMPPRESRPLTPLELEISYIDVGDNDRLAVGKGGTGPPLLIHPGWMSKLDVVTAGLDMRASWWAELAKNFEVVIFDRAGTGLSRAVARRSGLEESADEMISVMEGSFSTSVAVLAGSAAGPIVVHAAAERPELFSHVIFHDTYASGPAIFPHEVTNSLVALVKASWGMGSDVLTSLLFPSASIEMRDAFAEMQQDLADAETAAVLLRQMYDADVSASLEEVDMPCLVIHYRDDKAIPIWGGEELAKGIPGARFVPLDGRTHFPLPGDESAVTRLIVDFVEGR